MDVEYFVREFTDKLAEAYQVRPANKEAFTELCVDAARSVLFDAVRAAKLQTRLDHEGHFDLLRREIDETREARDAALARVAYLLTHPFAAKRGVFGPSPADLQIDADHDNAGGSDDRTS